MNHAERIERLCAEKGISVPALLEKAQLSPAQFSEWIKGVQPGFAYLEKICNVLNISMGEYFRNKTFILTASQTKILSLWATMSSTEKVVVMNLIEAIVYG